MEDELECSGFFFFNGYLSVLNTLKSKSEKWDVFDAMYEYATTGKLHKLNKLSKKSKDLFKIFKPYIEKRRGIAMKKMEAKRSRNEKNKKVCGKSSSNRSKTNAENCKKVTDNLHCNDDVLAEKIFKEESTKEESTLVHRTKEHNITFKRESVREKKDETSSSCKTSFATRAKRKIFIEPTEEEIKSFIAKNNLQVNATEFYYYYKSIDWNVGRIKLTDWQSKLIEWDERNKSNDRTGKSVKVVYAKPDLFTPGSQRDYSNLPKDVGMDNLDDIQIF